MPPWIEYRYANGLDAVSMRRVAAEVGAATMALYNYVNNKEDLLDLMIDAVSAEYELPAGPLGDWRGVLVEYVQSEMARSEAERQAGVSAEQFQASMAAYLGRVIASGRYPRFTQVIMEGATAPPPDADEIFERMVNRLLDGFSARSGT